MMHARCKSVLPSLETSREVVRAGDFLGIKVVEISQKTWEESHVIMKSLIRTKVLLDISYE